MNLQGLSEAFPPQPHWTAQDVPDLSDKVIAITGGYGGIGYYTLKALLDKNAKVYVLGRNESLFDDALIRLASESPPITRKPLFIQCDLSSLHSPVEAARQLSLQEPKLDILFCNAGVMILINSLLPVLLKVWEESNGINKARVVHTSSSGHQYAPTTTIDWESLKADKNGNAGNEHFRWVLYGQSKIGNIIVANEFHRRYAAKLISTSCNPGNLKTDLPRHLVNTLFFKLMKWVVPLITYPADLGALTQLYLGTAPCINGGEYGIPWARIGKPRADAEDEKIGKEVWEWLERECKTT